MTNRDSLSDADIMEPSKDSLSDEDIIESSVGSRGLADKQKKVTIDPREYERLRSVSSMPKKQNMVKTRLCPDCRSLMIVKTAKKGSDKGKHFWGCTNYPRCTTTCTYSEYDSFKMRIVKR